MSSITFKTRTYNYKHLHFRTAHNIILFVILHIKTGAGPISYHVKHPSTKICENTHARLMLQYIFI